MVSCARLLQPCSELAPEDLVPLDSITYGVLLYSVHFNLAFFTPTLLHMLLQDLNQLTSLDNGFDGINIVAQILWEAYKTRFNTGFASLLLLAIPMGANFICALHSITSASRFALIDFNTPYQHDIIALISTAVSLADYCSLLFCVCTV